MPRVVRPYFMRPVPVRLSLITLAPGVANYCLFQLLAASTYDTELSASLNRRYTMSGRSGYLVYLVRLPEAAVVRDFFRCRTVLRTNRVTFKHPTRQVPISKRVPCRLHTFLPVDIFLLLISAREQLGFLDRKPKYSTLCRIVNN
jgi:hypothetical protein